MVEHQSEQGDTRVFVVPVGGLVNCFRPFDHVDPTADEPGLIDRHAADHGTPTDRAQDEPNRDGGSVIERARSAAMSGKPIMQGNRAAATEPFRVTAVDVG